MEERVFQTEDHMARIFSKAMALRVPVSVLFELTHRCNLHCSHCYIAHDRDKELSFEELRSVLDELAGMGTLYATFSGGEALMRDDFFEIAQYARHKMFAVRIFTNGTLVNEQAADRITALTPMNVSVSLYGCNAEQHEYVTRVAGSFDASINALKLLNSRGVSTIIKFIVMKHNLKHVDEAYVLAEKLGAKIKINPQVTPKNNGNASPVEHRIDMDDMASLLLNKSPHDIPLDEAIPCTAGIDMASISPSGTIYPCTQLPIALGNVREKAFGEIWHTSQEAQRLRSLRISDYSQCANCKDVRYCNFCPGLNVVETGDLLKPASFNCWMAKARQRAVKA